MGRERGSSGPINEKGKPRKSEVIIEMPENNLVTNTDELALDITCHGPNFSFGKRKWKVRSLIADIRRKGTSQR